MSATSPITSWSSALARPDWSVAGLKPLCFGPDGTLYCARYDRIFASHDGGRTRTLVGQLEPHLRFHSLLGYSALAQRTTRAQIYRMRVLSDGTKIYVFRRGIYRQAPGESIARRTFVVPRGSRPVSLACGRDDFLVFGEYWANAERESVHIYGSDDRGNHWRPVHTFPAKDIRHVHGISYDTWDDCYWICTGDTEHENQLLRASRDFGTVEIVRQGGQGNRFYYLLVFEDQLLTATDTPLEANYVCAIDKRSGALRHLAAIENTNFYSCQVGNKVFLSTNAEPSALNDTGKVHLWIGDVTTGHWTHGRAYGLDLFAKLQRVPGMRKGLFQYSSIFFPEGTNPGASLIAYGLGIAGYDNCLFGFDTSRW